MSDKVFLDIVNMSITGSFAILIIILARLLLKKLQRFSPTHCGLLPFSVCLYPFPLKAF